MKRLLAVLLLSATSALAQDARTVVALEPAEREQVLGEMRGFLALIEKATAALARSDFDTVAALDLREHPRMPPGIARKLPDPFRKLAMQTHAQIAALAADAAKGDARHSLAQTSQLVQTCNACHAAYRF